jgi:hypothetical protein
MQRESMMSDRIEKVNNFVISEVPGSAKTRTSSKIG